MHTGYDNFWMYQNSRHEPVLNLPKNDNHSHAVVTDTYKQVLNGGSPNNFNSCIMPQNNVARSHHSDQHRITASQYVWPSSVYSLPFRSSQANNFHSQESYPNQCSNLSYSSQNYQVQENYDPRYLKNRNLNFSYVNNSTNSENNSRPVKTQNNQNTKTPAARIRVKDVFTLNSNSLFGNSIFQPNQTDQSDCSLNYAITNNLTSCDSKMPSEFMDYEKVNLLESSNLPSHYGHKSAEESHSNNQQEFLHHSGGSFYQSSDQPSSESEFQHSGSKEKNISVDDTNTSPSLNGQSKSHVSNTEPDKNYNDVQHGNKRIKVKPKRNSTELRNLDTSETRDFCAVLENCNQSHCSSLSATGDIMNNGSTRATLSRENLSGIENVNSFNNDTLIEKLRKWRKTGERFSTNSDSPPQNQINGKELNLIKITIPHIGKSSFLHFKDCSSVEGTSSVTTVSPLETKGQVSQPNISVQKKINTQKNELIIQFNHNSLMNNTAALNSSQLVPSPNKIQNGQASFTASISPSKTLESVTQNFQQEGVGSNNQENPNVTVNPSGCSENISENSLKNFNKSKEISTEIACHSLTLNSLVIKQETSEVENSQKQCSNTIQRECAQTIKVEKNSEDSSLHLNITEKPYSDNCKPLERMQVLDASRNENIDLNDKSGEKLVTSSKNHEPVSEVVPSCGLNNTGNLIQEVDAPKNTTDGKSGADLTESNTDSNNKLEITKVPASTNTYTSKINRDKLDLLIEFLNKQDDTVKNGPEETDRAVCSKNTDANNKMNKEVKPNRNRRKLSKTCIVKNKNNSREMISLLSHKIAQVEIFKCSSKTPPTVETNNSDNTEEKGASLENRPSIEKSDEKDTFAESRAVKDKIEEAITSSGEASSAKDKDFELTEKHTEVNNPLQTLQTQKDPLIFDTKDMSMSGNKKFQGASEECDIQEEESVINTMRAFQKFKTHFCMSCDLTSGVDSFWINVVSGELRCLNCFKKMLKAEDSVLKLKAEVSDSSNDSDTDLVQKSKPNENGDESKLKTGFENDLKNKTRSDFTEPYCGQKKVSHVKEGIKQELGVQVHEMAKDKIVNKSDVEHISDSGRIEITDGSNSSKRRTEPKENNVPQLEKNFEKLEYKVGESKNKSKEEACRKGKVCEGSKKQEVKEVQGSSRRKSFTKEDEGRMQSPEWRISPAVSKSNCSAAETSFCHSGRSALEGKNSAKKSVSPKCNSLESSKDELLPGESGKKIIYKESHIAFENSTQVSKEFKKHESNDKLEKSHRKAILKQDSVAEELIEKEKKLAKNLHNHIRKRNNSIEEVLGQKVQILEERPKKDLQLIENTDKSTLKTCSKGICACHKTHNLLNTMKINSKPDSDKLKTQNLSKETSFEYKKKNSGHTKSRDAHSGHEFRRKSGCSNNSVEKQKKVEVEQSRKRKNSEEHSSHKVRVVEEQTRKETKPVAHLCEGAKIAIKEHSGYYESKKVGSEKHNLKDSGEKSRRSSFSKSDYSGFGKFLKKEEKQVSDFSDKWNSKGDLELGRMKNSEHSKPEGMDPLESSRRRSKEERGYGIPKEHSKGDAKKIVGCGDKLKSFKLKEMIDSRTQATKIAQKKIKNGTLPPKVKEWEKSEKKEKRHISGKIPKRHKASSDLNISAAIKSPMNCKKEISDMAVRENQTPRVTSESPNVKCHRELVKSGGIMASKKDGRNDTEVKKREKEVFMKQGNLKKDKKELENDAYHRGGQGHTSLSNHTPKGKVMNCYAYGKERVYSSVFHHNTKESEKMESTTLLAKLIKKTKKLSWSLLKET